MKPNLSPLAMTSVPKEIPQVVVAGHICLDLIPSFPGPSKVNIAPGTLVQIGASTFSTGGVSNTAVALHRLGVPTKFVGKVGKDQFGDMVRGLLEKQSPLLSDGLIAAEGEITSYTYVISPPGVDRTFLHCPGANDTFAANDVPYEHLSPARFFHFGYPPLMETMRSGSELRTMFERVKQQGLITSLDLTYPDPASQAGQANWREIFQTIAPHLDIFLPSIEELLQMLDRPRFDAIMRQHGRIEIARDVDLKLVAGLADQLLTLGMGIVGIKLGDQGIYLRTSRDPSRLKNIIADDRWMNRELLCPCFVVEVRGTTGAGDCTIAGFLAAMLREDSPEQSLIAATAVGACCCEQPDATSGVPPWKQVEARLGAGWQQRPLLIGHAGWEFEKAHRDFIGPADRKP